MRVTLLASGLAVVVLLSKVLILPLLDAVLGSRFLVQLLQVVAVEICGQPVAVGVMHSHFFGQVCCAREKFQLDWS